ncbi:MAG TPA: hypothetical protein VMD06_10465, partial [Steroidobacteraceae bacterium]|nr:hypothetical protein [Steroidobacteraceae bacterium]
MLSSFFNTRPRPNAADRVLIASKLTGAPPFIKHSPRRIMRAALALIASAPLCLGAPLAALAQATAQSPTAAATIIRPPKVHGPVPASKRKPPKPARKAHWFNPATWPVLPVPLIAVDPNNGTTVGIIPT